MTNFERLIRSQEDMAKQLVWENCTHCPKAPTCKIEQRNKCLISTIEWLNKESDIN
ncbi:hypothetical protein RSJ2_3818 (plasmid) [Clostridium botulinum]|uniref:Uncharacterized protein n=1 Tax=Clostridium botulinum TaxID=1491 RepID=A0A1L7JMN1_CLOBO|nr:hypothetical protein [Clostridium botulinum]ACA57422.1 hypothetical protein CLK_A0112 [Clostridium botulinum A3 str. Loch Maree]APR02835.1 hypothetical protein RSJ2_3818 [Clostridium botulinum]APU87031.1 hypothetical protein NPD8_3952 [Clostridium botulinum]